MADQPLVEQVSTQPAKSPAGVLVGYYLAQRIAGRMQPELAAGDVLQLTGQFGLLQ